MKFISSKDQLADIFTKALSVKRFELLRTGNRTGPEAHRPTAPIDRTSGEFLWLDYHPSSLPASTEP